MSEGIILMERNNNFIYNNPAISKIFGQLTAKKDVFDTK